MSDLKPTIADAELLTALEILASRGAEKAFSLDLAALEKMAGRKVKPATVISLAMLGAETDDEIEFAKEAMSAFVAAS